MPNQKIKQIHFRLSEPEFLNVENEAKKFGLSASEFSKRLTLHKKFKQPKINFAEAKKMNYQLSKIGNNLNQITKRLNGTDVLEVSSIQQLSEEVYRLSQQLK